MSFACSDSRSRSASLVSSSVMAPREARVRDHPPQRSLQLAHVGRSRANRLQRMSGLRPIRCVPRGTNISPSPGRGPPAIDDPQGIPTLRRHPSPTTEAIMATPTRHVPERLCLAVAAALFAGAARAQFEAGAQGSGQAPVAAARAPTRKAAHPAQHAPMAPARPAIPVLAYA